MKNKNIKINIVGHQKAKPHLALIGSISFFLFCAFVVLLSVILQKFGVEIGLLSFFAIHIVAITIATMFFRFVLSKTKKI